MSAFLGDASSGDLCGLKDNIWFTKVIQNAKIRGVFASLPLTILIFEQLMQFSMPTSKATLILNKCYPLMFIFSISTSCG
jgi:hypothetical protein